MARIAKRSAAKRNCINMGKVIRLPCAKKCPNPLSCILPARKFRKGDLVMCFFGGIWNGMSFLRILSDQMPEYSIIYPIEDRTKEHTDMLNPDTWSLATASKVSGKVMSFMLIFLSGGNRCHTL